MSLARVACVIPARDVADRIQATVDRGPRTARRGRGDRLRRRQLRSHRRLRGRLRSDRGHSPARSRAGGGHRVRRSTRSGSSSNATSGPSAARSCCWTPTSAPRPLGLSTADRPGRHRARRPDHRRPAAAGPRGVGPAASTWSRPPPPAGIAELTGWTPRAPLATNRCLTRRAFELASPLAAGDGAEVGHDHRPAAGRVAGAGDRGRPRGRRPGVRSGGPARPSAGAARTSPGR